MYVTCLTYIDLTMNGLIYLAHLDTCNYFMNNFFLLSDSSLCKSHKYHTWLRTSIPAMCSISVSLFCP